MPQMPPWLRACYTYLSLYTLYVWNGYSETCLVEYWLKECKPLFEQALNIKEKVKKLFSFITKEVYTVK